MIATLAQARQVNPEIQQWQLDAYEAAIRQITNNNFQVPGVRLSGLSFSAPDKIAFASGDSSLFAVGDTVQVSASAINDGLYLVGYIGAGFIRVVDGQSLIRASKASEGRVSLVRYPADVLAGVMSLIRYDMDAGSKLGVASESIARMSVTYSNASSASTDLLGGYPKALMGFVQKYGKIRWGD
jgi:hypothetical protein